METSWIIILQNNSKCLRLNDKCHTRYCLLCYKSSYREVFCKKVVLRNFAKLTGKHLCQRLFFNKTAGLRPATLFKKRLWQRCFLVNFANSLRTPFFTEHFRWLVLLLDEMQNTKKDENARIERKEVWKTSKKKVREIR